MSKKDRAVVAVILIAALVAGLFVVHFSLEKARADQNAAMDRAMSNLGELPQSPPAQPEDEPGVEVIKPQPTPVPDVSEPSPNESAPDLPPDREDEEETSAAQTGSALIAALESGDFSSLEVLKELGLLDEEVRPSFGSEELTPQTLSDWMETESLEALAAQAAVQGAQAMAAGVGSEDDAQLRAFASSQGPANYQAVVNGLKESAIALSMEYLRCQQVLEVQQQMLEVFRDLETAVSEKQENLAQTVQQLEQTVTEEEPEKEGEGEEKPAQSVPQPSPLEIAQTQLSAVSQDLNTVTRLAAQAQTDVEQAQKDLDMAAQAIQQAVGNPPDAQLVFTGEFTPAAMPQMDVETAVTQALDNRNELKKAAFELIRAEKQLTDLRYQYPPNAPEVLDQQGVLTAAQAGILTLNDRIGLDIRQRHEELTKLAEALEQPTPQAPKETAAAYAVTESGSNGGELMDGWTQYEDEYLQYLEDVARMNVLALQFEHGVGVGTVSVEIAG